ncbi:hypothetical protein BSUA_00672 [Bacillus subtilis subsp. subtilis str. JH642 substr. AG174]|uniref:Uncharacterized protein YdiN n=1 Tax=Bacillus subtilis (strain 168) TaxID=224308 RepID=YDIN_BACSU|nr:RecName: Full=Uncharacterized protein YdiN; Flags: Precursor [Bacillus subtilis subsp. subtilis str. 168]AIC38983.1 hypothetical protein BSUA_00672 [Bacillus subtilis subsp. subtilis str. JH642 substr. AG174]AIC43215.1 hypothetical protein BSUB_00672 [Bacillus subtilis subsp. subtilis str. AG1839]AOT51126.1 hypothetical protein BH660_03505 [Bacillus subtilis subsp. subtilis]BAA22749.1 ydiN [Bacillus subtilis]
MIKFSVILGMIRCSLTHITTKNTVNALKRMIYPKQKPSFFHEFKVLYKLLKKFCIKGIMIKNIRSCMGYFL